MFDNMKKGVCGFSPNGDAVM